VLAPTRSPSAPQRITGIPGGNLYQLTDVGLAFAIFYTKVHTRILRPLLATNSPQAPPPSVTQHPMFPVTGPQPRTAVP
jgi:hypothetical protein